MKQSDVNETDKVDKVKVEELVRNFLQVAEGIINTVDHIAEVNTEVRDGKKVIPAAQYRMNLRQLKVKLMADLKDSMGVQ